MEDNFLYVLGILTVSGLVGALVGKYMFRRKGRSQNTGATAGAITSMTSAVLGFSWIGIILFAIVAYFLPANETPTDPV